MFPHRWQNRWFLFWDPENHGEPGKACTVHGRHGHLQTTPTAWGTTLLPLCGQKRQGAPSAGRLCDAVCFPTTFLLTKDGKPAVGRRAIYSIHLPRGLAQREVAEGTSHGHTDFAEVIDRRWAAGRGASNRASTLPVSPNEDTRGAQGCCSRVLGRGRQQFRPFRFGRRAGICGYASRPAREVIANRRTDMRPGTPKRDVQLHSQRCVVTAG